MAVLFDTNLLIYFARNPASRRQINPDAQDEYISIVNLAEIRSMAVQLNWGSSKLKNLEVILENIIVLDINNENIVDRYVQIDTFSQGKHPTIKADFSAKNMGKNDLWIAATCSFLDIPLFTTDGDFDHLDNTFLQLRKIDKTIFKKPQS
jgi:tRNA(fMet)-specific endonuclease VapC